MHRFYLLLQVGEVLLVGLLADAATLAYDIGMALRVASHGNAEAIALKLTDVLDLDNTQTSECDQRE